MSKVKSALRQVLFQVNWMTWTPEKRYLYLWQRTSSHLNTLSR